MTISFTLNFIKLYSLQLNAHFPLPVSTFPLAQIGEKKKHVPHDRLPSTEPKPTVLQRKNEEKKKKKKKC